MIECPKCHFDNELGRIFCHQCGNKLDLDKIKAPTEGAKMRRRVAGGVRKTVSTLIEIVIGLGLVAIIWLVCLVPDVKPVKPTNADLVGSDTKHRALERLVSGRQVGSLDVTEGELNTYINALGFDRPKGAGIETVPVLLRIDFERGTMKVNYIGELRLGDAIHKQFYFGMTGTPTIEDGNFVFNPSGGWIGKLPIHPKLFEVTGLFQSYLGKLFVKFDAERQALDKLSSITITPDQAALNYQPAPAK